MSRTTPRPAPRTPVLLPRLRRRQAGWVLAIALASIALSAVIDRLVGQFISLDPTAIRDFIAARGPLGPAVYVGLMVLAIVVTPIPSVPLDIAAGMAFGLVWGTIWTMLGALLGAVVCFALARWLGRPWLGRRLPATSLTQIDTWTERLGGRVLFLTRLLPVFNFDWVSYAAGLTPMPLRTFIVATTTGMFLPVIAIVYVGDQLLLYPGRAALVFGALVLAVILPLLYWLWRDGE